MRSRTDLFARHPTRPPREPFSGAGAAVALALLAGIVAPAAAADRLELDARVELRVDRAPLAVVLGHLGRRAGANAPKRDGTRSSIDRTGTTVSGPLHGTVGAVLASLVVDHALVLDVRDGALHARAAADRRVAVIDRSDAEAAARGLAAELPAASLPGNLLAATGRTLVIAGHPAFVARVASAIGSGGESGGEARASDAGPSARRLPDAAEPDVAAALAPTRRTPPNAPATSAPDGAGTSGTPNATVVDGSAAGNAIRSVDDVPGFY